MSKYTPPIIKLYALARKNGGVSFSKIVHLLPWLVKYTLFEPLRIAELLYYEKRIKNYNLENDPVFILGFYRGGTTFLQRLFIQDKNLGYQNVFQSALPELVLGFENLLKPPLNGISKLFGIKNDFHKIPFRWDFPGEEDVALTGLSFKESVNWGNLFPKAFDSFYEKYAWAGTDNADIDKWAQNYYYWIKKLSIRNKGKRLVLKSPPNTARINTLLKLFPDAKFVSIHRDPYQLYTSNLGFWKILDKYYTLQKLTAGEIKNIIFRSYDRTMECYYKMKDNIPPGNLIEITYEALASDPVSCFKNLYEYLDIGEFDKIDANVKEFVAATRNYPFVTYRHSEEERNMIYDKWHSHIDYWKKLKGENK